MRGLARTGRLFNIHLRNIVGRGGTTSSKFGPTRASSTTRGSSTSWPKRGTSDAIDPDHVPGPCRRPGRQAGLRPRLRLHPRRHQGGGAPRQRSQLTRTSAPATVRGARLHLPRARECCSTWRNRLMLRRSIACRVHGHTLRGVLAAAPIAIGARRRARARKVRCPGGASSIGEARVVSSGADHRVRGANV